MTDTKPTKDQIEIRCRFSGNVLFTHDAEGNTLRKTVEAAVSAGANLAGANLARANLARANLNGANLAGAYLAGAYLAGANLDGANLNGANLDRAYLYGANLAGAYLAGAYLAGANLNGANLNGANLAGETLTKAPLSLLNLKWSVLITEQYMRIGCNRYSHEEWAAMSDTDINQMDSGALKFWRKWRAPLLALCKQHQEVANGN